MVSDCNVSKFNNADWAKSFDKLNRISRSILKLTDEEIKAVEDYAKEQSQYSHPLKYATAGRINKAGNVTLEIVSHFKSIRDVVKENTGPPTLTKIKSRC